MYKISSDAINKNKKTWQSSFVPFKKAKIDHSLSISNICRPKRKRKASTASAVSKNVKLSTHQSKKVRHQLSEKVLILSLQHRYLQSCNERSWQNEKRIKENKKQKIFMDTKF